MIEFISKTKNPYEFIDKKETKKTGFIPRAQVWPIRYAIDRTAITHNKVSFRQVP